MVENDKGNTEYDIWRLYLFALKSPQTKEKYHGRMSKFFDFVGAKGTTVEEKCIEFVDKAKIEREQWAFNQAFNFMQYQIERVYKKEITGSTVQNYLKSLKLFYDTAEIDIPWNKIRRGLPRGKSFADDRIPTDDEIQMLLQYPDRRIRAIIYIMTSSGIRLGAWDYLRWGNLKPISENGEIVAAKMIVYEGDEEQYFTFISKEAYYEVKKWMDYRSASGEHITEDSWVMRDLWNAEDCTTGKGLASNPRKLNSSGIKRLVERAIWAQGLRKKLENGKRRHPFAALHCFRKWFKTKCELGGMRPINIEKLLSHSVGISNSYYRPTENEILEDYLKVLSFISLDEKSKLKNELTNIKEKDKSVIDTLNKQLKEKNEMLMYLKDKHQTELDRLEMKLDEQVSHILKVIQQNQNLAYVKPGVLRSLPV